MKNNNKKQIFVYCGNLLILLSIQFVTIFSINYSKFLIHCSIFFISTIASSIVINRIYGYFNTIVFSLLLLFLNYLLSQNASFYSFLGIFSSIIISNSFIKSNSHSFYKMLFIGLVISIFTDALIMFIFDISHLSKHRALNILLRSITYKNTFAILMMLIHKIVISLFFKKIREKKMIYKA